MKIPRGEGKGTWEQTSMGAKFRCPDCGFSALLRTHDMKPSGEVVPSIVCPIEGCDFHEFVILEGYADAA